MRRSDEAGSGEPIGSLPCGSDYGGLVSAGRRSVLTSFLMVLTSFLMLVAVIAAVFGTAGVTFAKEKAESWKAIDNALLRVNDVPVKDWSVFQTGKKTDPLLLQMGNRFLLIQIHEHKLFELDASKIEHKAEDVIWAPSDRPANPLASSDWIASDVGGAYRIGAKIDGENRVLDLQLPHPPNIGALPARTATPRRR